MNIGEFTALDREAQFAEAGRIAGVPPSVFDGMWRTESGRGTNMLSSAGAEGHFQIMPKTRATMEQRFGTTVDPYNFGQSLYTAAHLMKENMGRFKNVPDALRAYNGGWDAARWGNPETAAYAGKVLEDSSYDASTASVAAVPGAAVSAGRVTSPVSSLWDKPFDSKRPLKTAPTAVSKAVQDAVMIGGIPAAPREDRGFNIFDQNSEAMANAQLGVEKEKEDTTFLDATRAAAFRSLPVVLMREIFKDEFPVDPNFRLKEEDLRGYSLEEQKELGTAGSAAELERLKFDIAYGKEQDKIAFRRGTAFGLAASLIAMGPEAALTGGIASLAVRGAGVGAYALAARGDKAGALLSSTAEGVAANILNTAALDMLGERQGVNAYVIGAAGGLLNPLLQGRALGRAADNANAAAQAERLVRDAALNEERIMQEALRRAPEGHTPEELRKIMDEVEAEGLRSDIESHRADVPESRKMFAGTDDELEAISTVQKADEIIAREAGIAASATPASANNADNTSLLQKLVDEYGPNVRSPYEDTNFVAKQVASAREGRSDALLKSITGKTYVELEQLPRGVNIGEDLQTKMADNLNVKNAVNMIESLASEYMPPNTRVVISDVGKLSSARSNAGPNANVLGGAYSVGDTHVIAIDFDSIKSNRTLANHVAIHELGHTIFHANAPLAPKELMARMDDAWLGVVKAIREGAPKARADRLSITNPQRFDPGAIKAGKYAYSRTEYAAEQFVSHLQNRLLSGEFGTLNKTVINQVMDGVKAVINYSMDLLKKGLIKPGKEFDEFFTGILRGTFKKKADADMALPPDLKAPTMDELAASSDIPSSLQREVAEFLKDPEVIRSGLDRIPMGTAAERAEAMQILALWKKARSPEYVVDEKRLSTLLNQVDALNPTSNMMLRSKNPIMRMVAIELLENGGGAAGRRSTAAIAKYMNERSIVGTAIVDLDREFRTWFKTQPGASHISEGLSGKKRAEFDKLVAEEIEQRRYSGKHTDFGPEVRAAADSMELSFERARVMQVSAKTPGWAALPPSSKGYMPHKIKSLAYRSLTGPQKRVLHRELVDQFVDVSGYDRPFSEQLASKYLDRAEHRALGGFDAPMGLHQTGAADVIREALEQMNMSRLEIDAMMKRHTAGAANHTKKRLNIDLRKTLTADDGSTFRLLDLYDTDMLSLLRSQSQRVSGEVALARHGIMGKSGLAILRRAAGYGDVGEQTLAREIGAFDQVSAEFLGQPFGEVNKWVDRVVQYNSISSLGGMGFNQFGEGINIAATLGVKAALSNIASFGRLRSEILGLSKGLKVKNPLLDSVEVMGGAEFGTDAYKMVFPLDNPDLFANSMGADSITAGDRLLRGGGHLQTKLSLWRSIQSLQVRGVAEQIVLKAAKAMKSGGDYHLRDMGIDDDVLTRLRKDIDQVVTVRDGQVTGFDITKATDKEAAHAFIQGIHRGASQIIQGTFIGESGKYVHNSWLRMLTQFRSFSLTAIDKQWNRQVGNRGATGAILLTLAAMSVAAPIYMVRQYLAAIGRKDREEFLEKQLSFGAIARASTNYIATAGLAGDFVDALTAVTGTAEYVGGRSGTAVGAVGNLIAPAAGKVDRLWGAVQNTGNGTDPHALIKELPLSRLPFLIPAANALND